MCTGAMFKPLINDLTNFGYRCQVIQFTNQATIQDMVSICQDQAQTPGIFLGFSMGGIVALALAKTHPELITKLILLSSNSFADVVGRSELRQQQIINVEQTSLAEVITNDFIPLYLYQENKLHQQLIIAMAEQLGFDCFKNQLSALSTREDSLQRLKDFAKPVLIIAGQNDVLCRKEEQQKMHHACRNSDLVLIDECGHFPPLEQPIKTNSSILHWLNKTV